MIEVQYVARGGATLEGRIAQGTTEHLFEHVVERLHCLRTVQLQHEQRVLETSTAQYSVLEVSTALRDLRQHDLEGEVIDQCADAAVGSVGHGFDGHVQSTE